MLVFNICEAKHEGNPRFKSFTFSFLKAEKGHRKRGEKPHFQEKSMFIKTLPRVILKKGAFKLSGSLNI
jgi:hypothetical protein